MPEVEYKFWTDPALVEKLPEAARAGRAAHPVDLPDLEERQAV